MTNCFVKKMIICLEYSTSRTESFLNFLKHYWMNLGKFYHTMICGVDLEPKSRAAYNDFTRESVRISYKTARRSQTPLAPRNFDFSAVGFVLLLKHTIKNI